jgi:hypothetical protein
MKDNKNKSKKMIKGGDSLKRKSRRLSNSSTSPLQSLPNSSRRRKSQRLSNSSSLPSLSPLSLVPTTPLPTTPLPTTPSPSRRKSRRLSNSSKKLHPEEIVTYHLTKDSKICNFVEKMKNVPQIVNIPTPPENHAIFINFTDTNEVMISDWGGNNNRFIRREQWKYYHELIKCLEKKYKYKNVKYYKVDKELYDIAYAKHKSCRHGGCSEYLDLWLDKKYKNGYITVTETI